MGTIDEILLSGPFREQGSLLPTKNIRENVNAPSSGQTESDYFPADGRQAYFVMMMMAARGIHLATNGIHFWL
jgi:hypothetical protein